MRELWCLGIQAPLAPSAPEPTLTTFHRLSFGTFLSRNLLAQPWKGLTFTKRQIKAMSTTIAPYSRDKFFECDFPGCDSRYRRKEHLKRHQVNHETYAAVACPHCDQKLTRKDVQISFNLSGFIHCVTPY